MKFETHNTQIFRLLEEAVQLKEDSNIPCLVRYTEKGLVGEYNKKYFIGKDANAPFVCYKLDSDGEVELPEVAIYRTYLPHYCFEIVGTLVDTHSAEWGEYQTQQGIVVRHKHGCVVRPEYDSSSRASIFEHYPTGWQIYEETKPESENIIHGHIPADMHLKYVDLGRYKVGDWMEFIDVGGRKSQGKYLSNTQGNAIIVLETTCNMRVVVPMTEITRKLSPSEIVVRIGCLSGTVSRYSGSHIKLTHDSGCFSLIRISCLDTTTRQLVESLLKAQEGETK